MTVVWRLTRDTHAASSFDGEAAAKFPGRWNLPGTKAVYTAGSLSLAVLEILVNTPKGLPKNYVALQAHIPDGVEIDEIPLVELPLDWRKTPAPPLLAQLGSKWFPEGKAVALRVPSAVIPQEFNFVLNPAHRDFGRIEIGEPTGITWDSRIRPA